MHPNKIQYIATQIHTISNKLQWHAIRYNCNKPIHTTTTKQTIQYNTIHHSAMQYNTINPIQYITIQ